MRFSRSLASDFSSFNPLAGNRSDLARTPNLQSAPQPQMEGFAVTCPLAPNAPRLRFGFCTSPHSFGFSFLQTPPRGDALAVLLAFGSAKTWLPDFHRHSYVPCPAHTFAITGSEKRCDKGAPLFTARVDGVIRVRFFHATCVFLQHGRYMPFHR